MPRRATLSLLCAATCLAGPMVLAGGRPDVRRIVRIATAFALVTGIRDFLLSLQLQE